MTRCEMFAAKRPTDGVRRVFPVNRGRGRKTSDGNDRPPECRGRNGTRILPQRERRKIMETLSFPPGPAAGKRAWPVKWVRLGRFVVDCGRRKSAYSSIHSDRLWKRSYKRLVFLAQNEISRVRTRVLHRRVSRITYETKNKKIYKSPSRVQITKYWFIWNSPLLRLYALENRNYKKNIAIAMHRRVVVLSDKWRISFQIFLVNCRAIIFITVEK